MFYCQICGTLVSQGVSSHKIVLSKRVVKYPQRTINVLTKESRQALNRWRRRPRGSPPIRCPKLRYIEATIPPHQGWEPAEVKEACESCATRFADTQT